MELRNLLMNISSDVSAVSVAKSATAVVTAMSRFSISPATIATTLALFDYSFLQHEDCDRDLKLCL